MGEGGEGGGGRGGGDGGRERGGGGGEGRKRSARSVTFIVIGQRGSTFGADERVRRRPI